MAKISVAALVFMAFMGAANAQAGGMDSAPGTQRDSNGRLLNQDYLTPTGETVPHPGLSQGPGVTPLDRNIRNQDDRVEKSICSNC